MIDTECVFTSVFDLVMLPRVAVRDADGDPDTVADLVLLPTVVDRELLEEFVALSDIEP